MKKSSILILTAIVLCSLWTIQGCKKDSKDTDTETAADNSLAEGTFNDVNNIANQAYANGGSGLSTYRTIQDNTSLLSGCASISLTPDATGSGGTVSIDFGTSPCYCVDHRYRKGIINLHYTGSYLDSGSVNTITFQDYYVGNSTDNMFKVTGTKTVTNKGHNDSGHLWYSINVNGYLTNNSNQTLNWNSTRVREWIAGESTSLWLDDEYYITGSVTGTGFSGNEFTVNIINPLHIALNCYWIKDGTFELTPAGKPTRTFDYGNGDCDHNATVTINGQTFGIIMR